MTAWTGSPETSAQPFPSRRVFSGHEDAVTMGTFAPDGTTVLTASLDQTVRQWQIESAQELRRYSQHTGPVFCLAISGDGRTLVTGAQDNTARVWDLPLGIPLTAHRDHEQRVNAMALSPSGGLLVSGSSAPGIRIRDLKTGEVRSCIESAHAGEVLSIAFRGDGAAFASSDSVGNILIWSPYLREPQLAFRAHQGAVSDVAFTANNQLLISAGDDGVIRSWKPITQATQRYQVETSPLLEATFAEDGSRSLCVFESGRVVVLDPLTGQIVGEHPKLDSKATGILLAPQGDWYVVAEDSGRLQLRNMGDGSTTLTFAPNQGPIHDLAIAIDSPQFATAGADGKVIVWEPAAEKESPPTARLTLSIDSDPSVSVRSLTYSDDRQHLLGGASNGTIYRWRLSDGQLVQTLPVNQGSNAAPAIDLALIPNQQSMLSVHEDQTLRHWNLVDGSLVQAFVHPTTIRRVTVSPDGNRAAVAGDDGAVRLWDLKSGQFLETLANHSTPVAAIAFASRGQAIVSASKDQTWQVSRPTVEQAWPVHPTAIRSMALFAGGSQVVSCDQAHVLLTNLSNGSTVREYKFLGPLRSDDMSSSDDASNKDGAADTASGAGSSNGQDLASSVEPQQKPTVVAVRPDNQRIAVGTEDGQVWIWNANNGDEPLVTLRVGGAVTGLAYSADSQKLAVATSTPELLVFGPSLPGTSSSSELVLHQQQRIAAIAGDVQFTADGREMLIGLANGTTETWNYAGVAQRLQLGHGGPVYGVAISHDGKLIVSCGGDQIVRVWDGQTGQQKAQLRGHNGPVHSVAISRDETFAVSSGSDGTLRLWDVIGGRQLKQLVKMEATMYSVAIHPEGQLVAAAGADRKIHLLDMISGQERQTLAGHHDYIHSVGFAPSGDQLLSYGYAGELKIWKTDNGQLLHQWNMDLVGNDARFSPDGHAILLSNGDATATLIPNPNQAPNAE